MSSRWMKIAPVVLSATFAHLGAVSATGIDPGVAINDTWSDESSQEPLSVLNKLMEVETVGDIKAALSLFADDAIIVNTVGNVFSGPSLALFVAQDIAAHDQFLIERAEVQGDNVSWTKSVTAGSILRGALPLPDIIVGLLLWASPFRKRSR